MSIEEPRPVHLYTTSEAEMRAVMAAATPLFALKYSIQDSTALRPNAIMLPSDLLSQPSECSLYGVPVIWGDRAALIYEPVKARTD